MTAIHLAVSSATLHGRIGVDSTPGKDSTALYELLEQLRDKARQA